MEKTDYIVEYQCPFYKIIKEEVKLPDGETATYFTHVANNPFIAVIAIEDEQVLIQHQFRPTIKAWNWEFPMGAINSGEKGLKAAQRELLEETGYKASNWTELGFFYIGLGHTNNRGFVFLAHNLIKTNKQELGEAEIIQPKLIKIKDFEKMIAQGTIVDAPTLACWQIYQQKIVTKAYASFIPKRKK